MASVVVYLGILLAAGIVFAVIGIFAYNRRLDKIARGEERDTHSSIPEPGTTVNGVYRVVLMILVVASFLIINALNGKINALQSTLLRMESQQNGLQDELRELKEQIENQDKVVWGFTWEIGEADYTGQTAEVEVSARLKEYTDNTAVVFQVNGMQVPLTADGDGNFRGTFTGHLFERYENPMVLVTEDGRTAAEETDFPEEIFWNFFPMPGLECNLQSDGAPGGKMKYSGWYKVITDRPEEIASAQITYMSEGRDLKTIDITEEAHNLTQIELEKGLDVKTDLTLRIEITTKEGYKIENVQAVIFEASPDYEEKDSLRILDAAGKIVWEDDFK